MKKPYGGTGMDRRKTGTEKVDRIEQHDIDTLIETLMNRYGSDLKKLAYSYVKDWGKAENIAQDVFVICYRKIKSFKGRSSVKTWLYRITVNRCKDVMKSWSFRNIRPTTAESMNTLKSHSSSPEGELVRRNENQQLADRVMELPIKYKEVIILHYYSELKTEEIAEALKLNANTVRTRLTRARALLRKMYEEGDTNGR
jgi:RNA polymerase sigma-70 factor (ECF subfamily)